MSKAVCVTGVLLMLHAAISIAHLRSIVRSRGETETRLPFDILLEVQISFCMSCGTIKFINALV